MYPTTGRSEDLLALFARAEAARAGLRSLAAAESAGEAAGMAFGRVAAAAWALLPPEPWLALHDRVFRRFSGIAPMRIDPAAVDRASAAARGAGLLCLLSHPGPEEGLGLNVELVRSALLTLRAVRGRPCRPRLLAAVDPFALDGLGWRRSGPYAGYLAGLHLGVDRLCHGRGPAARLLLGRCAWPAAIWRVLRVLRSGGELAMVLSGGVPATSRAIYGVREAFWDLRRRRPGPRPPSQVLAALPAAGGSRSAWRRIEQAVVSELCADPGALERGELTDPARAAFAACARALGWPQAAARSAADSFAADFARNTPYRVRLFRVLAARLRGKPVLLLPLTHAGPGGAGLGPAAMLPEPARAEAFAREFVRARYF